MDWLTHPKFFRVSGRLAPNLKMMAFFGALFMSWQATATAFPTSGDPDIDRVRREARTSPTDQSNFKLRGFLMKQWLMALQQQGASAADYLPIDEGMRRIVHWNTLFQDGRPQQFSAEQLAQLCRLIDDGYRILEQKQQAVSAGQIAAMPGMAPRDVTPAEPLSSAQPWPHYKGNPQRSGYTGAPGPQRGEGAWKFPVGLAWESRPVIEDGRVYVATPGMRSVLQCLDLDSGEPIWIARQEVELVGDQLYSTPASASTPIVLKDRVLVRQMGSRGNHGPARHVVQIDKSTGAIIGQIPVGHVDYRAGYAPLAANEQYIVTPHGVQDIEATPPTAQGFNRIVCRDASGNVRWDFSTGLIFAEPVIRNDRVFAATRSGYVYCLRANVPHWRASREHVVWEYNAGAAVNRAVTVHDDGVYFGANDGMITCLDASNGEIRWRTSVCPAEPRAFRQFSSPLVYAGRVYVGGADQRVHVLDAASGQVIFRVEADDWVRARPVAIRNLVVFATLKGTLFAIDAMGKSPRPIWSKRFGEHPIYADLAGVGDQILFNSSDLYTYCVSPDGELLWKRALLAGFDSDGARIHTEQIAGGAYYQSKPTAANGKVFFGTPGRFVHALDAATGEELWKFELGAAVSGAPEFYKGRIYIGQQGGENDFYCLDAETGQPIWSQSVGWVWGSACVDNGQVFIPEIEGWAYCLDADTGAIRWRYRTERSLCTEPFVDQDTVYFGGWDRFLHAFERQTGKILWRKVLSGGSDSGVPALADGRIYLPIGGNQFRCLDAKTGRTLWRYKEDTTNFNVTPAYHDGRVYISMLRGLGMGGIPVVPKIMALDSNSGELLWEHDGGGLTGPVVGRDGQVFIASTASPYLYCFEGTGDSNGQAKLLWTYRMGNKVEESVPCLYGNYLYILGSDGYLHAVK